MIKYTLVKGVWSKRPDRVRWHENVDHKENKRCNNQAVGFARIALYAFSKTAKPQKIDYDLFSTILLMNYYKLHGLSSFSYY